MNGHPQLPLNLSYRKAWGRADFIVAPCNREAVLWIDRSAEWPAHALLIYGEKGAGKTHLASIFSPHRMDARDLKSGAELAGFPTKVVEDISAETDETALFHLLNLTRETGGRLLLTALSVPAFKLPDLQSRVSALPKAQISFPDEQFVADFLRKEFAERHLRVEETVIAYAAPRITRSFNIIQSVVREADALSLSCGRKLTVPLMKEAIGRVPPPGRENVSEKIA